MLRIGYNIDMYLLNPYIYGGAASYIVDDYSAPVAYSVRKISSTATNCLRVRRSSDNAEQDIGFSGVDLDTASLSSFVGANTGYVTKWYNQGTAGSTYDYVQSNATLQPRIVNAGTIDTKNGLTAIYFSGSTYLDSANYIDSYVAAPQTLVTVASNESSNSWGYVFSARGGTGLDGSEMAIDRRTNKFGYNYTGTGGAAWLTYTAQQDNSNLCLQTATADASYNIELFRDGVSQATGTATAPSTSNVVGGIGSKPWQRVNNLVGYVQEAYLFNTDESANRTDIESDINTYYSIY